MRIDNWSSKLETIIIELKNKKEFIRGKNDCGTFVIECIETITGKKVFNKKYKSLSEFKKILKQLKKNSLLDLINQIAEENNFQRIDINRSQRGDVLYYKDNKDLEGTVGVCIGEMVVFNWKENIILIEKNKCEIAWRIE
tara:strand:- start:2040 stop:2459 length:420 start_codon:yes stop_codon:yes gene_type:complete